MKTYTAYAFEDGPSIISVGAHGEEEARQKVQEQLDRPGRYGLLVMWVNGGKIVKERKE